MHHTKGAILEYTLRRADKTRFWGKVDRGADRGNHCWLWTAYKDRKWGYGKFGLGGSSVLASRAAWAIESGDWPPDDLCVLHVCDQPGCVRNDDVGIYVVNFKAYPRLGHLYLADRIVNNQDMAQKGRRKGRASVVGSQVGTSKLVDADVLAIRAMAETGRWSQEEIAGLFRITQANVSEIILRHSWKHL